MNRLLIVIPILFSSILYSCNSVTYTVNEIEFINAINMNNIDCIQANYSFSGSDSIYKIECYPRLVHKTESYFDTYEEYYIERKLDNTYIQYSRESKGSELISSTSSKKDFDLVREEIIQFINEGVEYKDLKYDENSKTYTAKVNIDPPNNEIETLIYKFEDKRIVSFKRIVTDVSDTLVTYTYNQETPKIK